MLFSPCGHGLTLFALQSSASGMPGSSTDGNADPRQPQLSVSYEMISASATNMSMFDRLSGSGIMRKDGVIIKCMEDYIEGFQARLVDFYSAACSEPHTAYTAADAPSRNWVAQCYLCSTNFDQGLMLILHVSMQVSDKLRDMLLNPDSDNAELYSPEERHELLFRIFQHLCLGGSVNQFEVSN